jgi:hypothetical protein
VASLDIGVIKLTYKGPKRRPRAASDISNGNFTVASAAPLSSPPVAISPARGDPQKRQPQYQYHSYQSTQNQVQQQAAGQGLTGQQYSGLSGMIPNGMTPIPQTLFLQQQAQQQAVRAQSQSSALQGQPGGLGHGPTNPPPDPSLIHVPAGSFNSIRLQRQAQQQAAQAQAQAQNLAFQGQPSGRGSSPLPPQQSPAMATLNAPLRTPAQSRQQWQQQAQMIQQRRMQNGKQQIRAETQQQMQSQSASGVATPNASIPLYVDSQLASQSDSGNHALQDYQMQLKLLEQRNKKRFLTARQEQDGMNAGRPVEAEAADLEFNRQNFQQEPSQNPSAQAASNDVPFHNYELSRRHSLTSRQLPPFQMNVAYEAGLPQSSYSTQSAPFSSNIPRSSEASALESTTHSVRSLDERAVRQKHTRNTLAARRSRQKKASRYKTQETEIGRLEKERDMWKEVATIGQEQRFGMNERVAAAANTTDLPQPMTEDIVSTWEEFLDLSSSMNHPTQS